MVSRSTTLVPSLGLCIGPACEAGLSAGMRRERVSPQIGKKERSVTNSQTMLPAMIFEIRRAAMMVDTISVLHSHSMKRPRPLIVELSVVCLCVTYFNSALASIWNFFKDVHQKAFRFDMTGQCYCGQVQINRNLRPKCFSFTAQ